jgi:hypothetical protein
MSHGTTRCRETHAERPSASCVTRSATRAPGIALVRDPVLGGRRPGALGAAFVLAGLAMIPWVFYLSVTLPAREWDAHWSLTWVGLDGCEALALFAIGRFLLRRDNRCVLTAVGTAVLLLVDAWFDVTSASSGPDLATAIVMAVFDEIPSALVCAVLAARVLRSPFPRG